MVEIKFLVFHHHYSYTLHFTCLWFALFFMYFVALNVVTDQNKRVLFSFPQTIFRLFCLLNFPSSSSSYSNSPPYCKTIFFSSRHSRLIALSSYILLCVCCVCVALVETNAIINHERKKNTRPRIFTFFAPIFLFCSCFLNRLIFAIKWLRKRLTF